MERLEEANGSKDPFRAVMNRQVAEFKVELDQFEGPLDLMLHLIQKNKLDLFDLNLDILAEQYIRFVRQVQKAHLEVASEYLIELSSLLEYKSRKLLPKKEAVLDENYEEDQRDQLARRLIEYQQYKKASKMLDELYEKRSHQLCAPVSSKIETWQIPVVSDTLRPMELKVLIKAMQRVLRRQALANPYETSVEVQEISVEEMMEQLEKRLKNLESSMAFESLLQPGISLHEVIVTFLAVLELIHQQKITFFIDEKENIWIQKPNLNAKVNP